MLPEVADKLGIDRQPGAVLTSREGAEWIAEQANRAGV